MPDRKIELMTLTEWLKGFCQRNTSQYILNITLNIIKYLCLSKE